MSLHYSVRMAPPTCQHGIHSFQYLRMYCNVLKAPPTCKHSIYTVQQLKMCCYVLRAPPTCKPSIYPVANASTTGPRHPCTYQQQREATQAGTG